MTEVRTPALAARLTTAANGGWLAGGGEQRLDGRAIADVELMEAEVVAALQLREPPLLQPRIVGVVEVIDAHHGMARPKQQVGDVRGDKTGATGNQVSFGHDGAVLIPVAPGGNRRFRPRRPSAGS